jgi:hypothetical protein
VVDVFISYSKKDPEQADRMVLALETRGWTVWLDRNLRGGDRFDDVIEARLKEAAAVVVLWTRHSVASNWVKQEAAFANKLGRLVPVRLDDVDLPLAFFNLHCYDFPGWNGSVHVPGFSDFMDDVEQRIDVAGGPRKTVAPSPAPPLRVPVLKARDSGLLTWMPVFGATGYEVQRCDDEYFLGPKESVWEGDDLMYSDPALALTPVVSPSGRWRSTRSFYYRVRATRAGSPDDHSEWSEPVRVTSK